MAIGITRTPHATANIIIDDTNGGITLTPSVINTVTQHTDFIDALTCLTTTIAVISAVHTTVGSDTFDANRSGITAASIICRVAHRTRTGHTFAIGTTTVPINPARHALTLTIVLDAKLTRVATAVRNNVTADTRTSIANGGVGIGAIVVDLAGNTLKARSTVYTIGRIDRTPRPIEGVAQLTGVIDTLLGAIAIVITSTRSTSTSISIGHTPRRGTAAPSIIRVIADNADLSYALLTTTITITATP